MKWLHTTLMHMTTTIAQRGSAETLKCAHAFTWHPYTTMRSEVETGYEGCFYCLLRCCCCVCMNILFPLCPILSMLLIRIFRFLFWFAIVAFRAEAARQSKQQQLWQLSQITQHNVQLSTQLSLVSSRLIMRLETSLLCFHKETNNKRYTRSFYYYFVDFFHHHHHLSKCTKNACKQVRSVPAVGRRIFGKFPRKDLQLNHFGVLLALAFKMRVQANA